MPADDAEAWRIYHGDGLTHDGITGLPVEPPRWRSFRYDVPDRSEWAPHPVTGWLQEARERHADSERFRSADSASFGPPRPDSALTQLGRSYRVMDEQVKVAVNAALQLRRPLLVTGDPGTGKTVLAYSIAYELGLGPVLRWNITSRSTLQDGLYSYDILDRVNDTTLRSAQGLPAAQDDLGEYLTLGPLGDALLPRERPRLLLIDEMDKSDIDLPNDLLHTLETGAFDIPELRRASRDDEPLWVRSADGGLVPVYRGRVHCAAFPVVVMTSNREREFPPAFQRRCIRVSLRKMDDKQLKAMAHSYFEDGLPDGMQDLIQRFDEAGKSRKLATDQLLNLLYLRTRADALTGDDRERVIATVLQSLDGV